MNHGAQILFCLMEHRNLIEKTIEDKKEEGKEDAVLKREHVFLDNLLRDDEFRTILFEGAEYFTRESIISLVKDHIGKYQAIEDSLDEIPREFRKEVKRIIYAGSRRASKTAEGPLDYLPQAFEGQQTRRYQA